MPLEDDGSVVVAADDDQRRRGRDFLDAGKEAVVRNAEDRHTGPDPLCRVAAAASAAELEDPP